ASGRRREVKGDYGSRPPPRQGAPVSRRLAGGAGIQKQKTPGKPGANCSVVIGLRLLRRLRPDQRLRPLRRPRSLDPQFPVLVELLLGVLERPDRLLPGLALELLAEHPLGLLQRPDRLLLLDR